MANINKKEISVLIYDVEIDGARWWVYWLGKENILGVTDLGRRVYAIQLDRDERKKFMGNMADSMLKNHWEKIFQNKQFKIVKADHESVQLKYTPSKFLELARIEEENSITEANKKLFVNYVEATRDLLNATNNNKRAASESDNGSPNKRSVQWIPKAKPRHVPGPVLRGPIVFDDLPEESSETEGTSKATDEAEQTPVEADCIDDDNGSNDITPVKNS